MPVADVEAFDVRTDVRETADAVRVLVVGFGDAAKCVAECLRPVYDVAAGGELGKNQEGGENKKDTKESSA